MNNTTDNMSVVHTNTFFEAATTTCGFFMLFVFLCSLTLSTSILWALWKTNTLQSSVYRMVAYILFDEVMVRIFGSPLIVTSMLAGRWLYGDLVCVFYAFWMTWLGVTSTSLFMCVAVERYVIICQRDTAQRITRKVVDTTGLICHLHGLVWACLPLAGISRYVYDPSGVSCTPDWSRDNIGYILGLFTVAFLMPVLVSLFCYSAIFHTVRRRRRLAVTLRNSQSDTSVAFTLAITMAAFLLAWTPYAVISLYNSLGFTEQIRMAKELSLIPLVTAKTAGILNPIVFSVKNMEVRAMLATSFNRARECKNFRIICRQESEAVPDTEMQAKDSEPFDENSMRNENAIIAVNNASLCRLQQMEETLPLTSEACENNTGEIDPGFDC